MSAQFDWQTDEDGEWEEIVTSDLGLDTAGQQPTRFFRPRIALIIVCLVFGSFIIVVRRQVLRAEETVRQDVLAVNMLAIEAAFEGDAELFRTLLSGRNESWSDTQIVLADQDLALGNSARLFGLEPRPGDLDLQILNISPDLNEVELEVTQRYRAAGPSSTGQPVALSQTLIYRRGHTQWLLSPPDENSNYWGNYQSLTGRYLTILYPTRDAEFVERMAEDIEADLSAICARLPANCPADWHIVLRLESNPASLLSMAGQKYLMDIGPSVIMPTPSLVGRPVDETGYEHLYRAYSTYIVSLTLTRVVEYECCRQAVFYSAMLNWFMATESVSSWPLSGHNYATTLHSPISLDTLQDLYTRANLGFLSANEEMMVYAFVEFMLVKAAGKGDMTPELASLAAMTERLADHTGFWSWVESMSDYSSRDQEQLVQDWIRFVDSRNEMTILAVSQSVPPPKLTFSTALRL